MKFLQNWTQSDAWENLLSAHPRVLHSSLPNKILTYYSCKAKAKLLYLQAMFRLSLRNFYTHRHMVTCIPKSTQTAMVKQKLTETAQATSTDKEPANSIYTKRKGKKPKQHRNNLNLKHWRMIWRMLGLHEPQIMPVLSQHRNQTIWKANQY